jgi:short-chain fatty acids transporter
MPFTDAYTLWARRLLPAPFGIAAVLTVVVLAAALAAGGVPSAEGQAPAAGVLDAWARGLWNAGGMVFTLQMMLILVLGHALALSPPAERLIRRLLRLCRDTPSTAATVAFVAMSAAYVNWGLGLVLGAIFARQAGEHARRAGFRLNYPLVGAAGYLGLMVWHGGLSGSAPVTVNSPGHNLEAELGLIPLDATLGSAMNLTAVALTLLLLPALFAFLGRRWERRCDPEADIPLPPIREAARAEPKPEWAERLDHGRWAAWAFGALLVAVAWRGVAQAGDFWGLRWLTLDWINGALLAAGLLLHGSFARFTRAVDEAMPGAAGIAVQFPLYFGIMGVMREAGLIADLAGAFTALSTPATFPLFGMLSAGLVNVFVPSGGGQWQVQGPILIEAARQLGVPDAKAVMALAYGDQLTNMLQPFWALPLLGITGLQARFILPYTLIALAAGLGIFAAVLLLF